MLAFATSDRYADLTPDDRRVAELLSARGVTAEPAVWSDPRVAWERFEAVVIRSCWDYHLRADEFAAWLDRLESLGVRVWNPPAVVRWNMDKRYLGALAAAGVPVVPTHRLDRGEDVRLTDLLAAEGWDEAVVKPAVSASAYETRRVSAASAAAEQPAFAALVARTPVLVQPFDARVAERGELSLVFFRGAFSHALRKRPAAGDFRVQEELGGETTLADAPSELVRAARRVLATCAVECERPAVEDLLYARVDGVAGEGSEPALTVMEVELIEPSFYLHRAPAGAGRFAEAIVAALR